MGDQQPANRSLTRAINEGYAAAKFWQNAAIWLQIGVYVAGVLAVFWPTFSPSFPPLAIVFAVAFAIIKLRISFLKGNAESLKRIYEYYDGFGGTVPTAILADLEAHTPEDLPQKMLAELDLGLQFASVSAAGERRALENLQENAWWSKAGASRTRNILLWIFGVVLVATVVLLAAMTLHNDPAALGVHAKAGKIIAATLLCLFSLNLLPGIWGFHRFAAKAQDIDAECERRLGKTDINPLDALRLVGEYQLARASAPMIPTFIWSWGKEKLNRAWNLHKTKNA